MYTNVFLSRLPLFFSLSLSPPPHCKSTSSLFALRRSILLLHPALRRFPLLFISPPLPPSSLSLSFSPRSFLTLCTRICTYTQCSLSLSVIATTPPRVSTPSVGSLLTPYYFPAIPLSPLLLSSTIHTPLHARFPPRSSSLPRFGFQQSNPSAPFFPRPLCLFRIHAICIRVTSMRVTISAIRLSHHLHYRPRVFPPALTASNPRIRSLLLLLASSRICSGRSRDFPSVA